MELTNAHKAAIGASVLLAVYLAGVMTAKSYIKPDVVTKTETRVVDHTITVIKTVKQPNGGVETTTTIDDNRVTKAATTVKDPCKPPYKANIALSYGLDFRDIIPKPVYGLHISEQFIGPVSLGIYLLTSKTVGVSVGYSF